MEWGTPVLWGKFLLFSRSGGHKTKETYPTRPGSPTTCKQGLRPKNFLSKMVWHFIGVYIINGILHGRLEIRNFFSRVEKNSSLVRAIFFNTRREISYLRAAM